MSSLRRESAELLVAAEAVLYFACTSLALALPPRLVLLPIVRQALAGTARSGAEAEGTLPARRRLVAVRLWRVMDKVSGRLPWEPKCLQRSLVLVWLLRRHGLKPSLAIGIRLQEHALEAHAWAELGGTPVGEVVDPSETFRRFPGASEAWLLNQGTR